ncbi:MAG: carboxypeptidase regulatory-like domain-containing protein [Candidatus Cloacimonetes bacterium]|nr:carboxypeptidase regulatory-like domain-containing protein [Candidatus Cloacimonadota bacterium]
MKNLIIIIILLSAYVLHSASISGNVSAENGEPIFIANINLVSTNDGFSYSEQTDESGDFLIEDIFSGEYYLIISAFGYPTYYENTSNPIDATILVFEEDTAIEGLEIVLIEREIFEVTGIVLDASSGQPIENAEVWALTGWPIVNEQQRRDQGFTDENGEYSLEVFEGDYYFETFAENYELQWFDHQNSWEEAEVVTINTDTENINFDLDIAFLDNSFFGTITNENGNPIPDISIDIWEKWDGYWMQPYNFGAITDENGEYIIENVRLGDCIVSCSSYWGMQPFFYENTYNIEEAVVFNVLEDSNFEANFILNELDTSSISGTVLDDETGEPIENALVWVRSFWGGQNDSLWIATTDINGEYSLSMNEDEYSIQCYANEYYCQWFDHKNVFDEADVIYISSNLENVNFDLTPIDSQFEFYISGNVTIDGETPSQCTVIVVSSDEDWENEVEVFSNGDYEIGVQEEGDYYVYAYMNSSPLTYYDDVYNFENATLVNVNQNVQNIDFALQLADLNGYITFNGYVYNEDNEPLRNSSIVILNAANEPESYAMTNNDGYFNSINITPGNYFVLASKIFHYSDSEYLTINQNDSLDFHINTYNSSSLSEELTSLESNKLTLYNYPNPFNPETTIFFETTNLDEEIQIEIFNIKGQLIREFKIQNLKFKINSIVWDGTDEKNNSVSSGIYFYKLKTSSKVITKKMILLR